MRVSIALLLSVTFAAPAPAQERVAAEPHTSAQRHTSAQPYTSAQEGTPSLAQDSHSAAAKILLYGNSPGSPSGGKLVTVFTLHALTLAALGTGTLLLVDRAAESDELKQEQAAGCASPEDCGAQAEREGVLNRQGSLAMGAFALGGLALLSSITTAFTWHNESSALNVTLAPTGAWATVTF